MTTPTKWAREQRERARSDAWAHGHDLTTFRLLEPKMPMRIASCWNKPCAMVVVVDPRDGATTWRMSKDGRPRAMATIPRCPLVRADA